MDRRFYRTWKIWTIGLILIAFLIPSVALAQGYKLFKSEDFISKANPDPSKNYREEILTDKDAAKELGGILVVVPPSAPGAKVRYHFHRKRESVLVVLSGEATEMVEGKAIPIKAGDVIFLLPNFKHSIVNNSNKELRVLEFFTYPPVTADAVTVD
jgi:quercetin dioxygenase-like cupin family protein